MPADLYYRVSIQAGGASYDLSPALSTLVVEEDTARPDQLTLTLSDPYKVYSHALREGMAVEVDLGTTEDHSVVFRGHFYQVNGDFPQDGVPTLRLLAYDRSMRMGLRRRSRPWSNVALSDIVRTIGRDYFTVTGIRAEPRGDPEFAGNGIRQQNETDLAFLYRLATYYGCEMFVVAGDRDDALHFIDQYSLMRRTPEVTLYQGRCGVAGRLLRFEASSDVSRIQLPRAFSGIDFDTGETNEETARVEEAGNTDDSFAEENFTAFSRHYPERAPQLQTLTGQSEALDREIREQLGSETREATPGFTTAEELRLRADNQFSNSLRGMHGSGAAVGNHRLHAQVTIRIADGGRFSGTWYLSQVRHSLNLQGYQTEFQCQR